MDATMNKMMTSITILQLAVGDVVKVMNALYYQISSHHLVVSVCLSFRSINLSITSTTSTTTIATDLFSPCSYV